MLKKKRSLSREARRDIAYGLYVRSAIRRFDLEGKLEAIRQLAHAPSCDADDKRARQHELPLDVAPAFRVRPQDRSMKRSRGD